MPLAAYNGTLQDSAGNASSGTVAVRRESDGQLATIYQDRDGITTTTNPISVGADGAFLFYAQGDAYKLVATASGAQRTFRHVGIGLGSESDLQVLTISGAWDSSTTYEEGDFVYHEGYLFASRVDSNLNSEPDSATPGDTDQWMFLGQAGAITGTSTTSLTVGTGSKSFTTQSGRGWIVGQRIRAASDDASQVMEGEITAYSGTTLTITVDYTEGSGTHADWNIGIAGARGAQGEQGATGSQGPSGADGVDGSSTLTICRVVATTSINVDTDLEIGDTIDGVVLEENNRVLVTNEVQGRNGVYLVGQNSPPETIRDPAFPDWDDHCGVYFSVMEGTTNADTLWVCTSDVGEGSFDGSPVDPLAFQQFQSGGGAASDVSFTPAGGIAATNVQDAIQEVDSEAAKKAANLSDLANAATAFGNIKQAATATATGVVELATTAEAAAGSDNTRAVTPAGVASAIAGAKLPRVAQTVDVTNRTTTSATYAATGVEVSLGGTLRDTDSKVLVSVQGVVGFGTNHIVSFTLARFDGTTETELTPVGVNALQEGRPDFSTAANGTQVVAFEFLDSPGDATNTLVYRLKWKNNTAGAQTSYLGRRAADTTVDAPTIITAREVFG